MKILIVDDNHNRVATITTYLTNNQIAIENIEHVDHTDAARNILRKNYYDILILDVVLPKRVDGNTSATNGLDLLKTISSSNKYKKSGRIIGITGYDEDITKFREDFDKFCFTVISTSHINGTWLSTLFRSISYASASKLAQVNDKYKINVLTIHGIRTFGQWQNNLEQSITTNCDEVKVTTYKYGLYSIISFAIPFLRPLEIKRLINQLSELIDGKNNEHLVIFSHSFGTYLIAKALKSLIADGIRPKLKLLVTSGSVLPNKFDWNFLLRSTDTKIVNDCGTSDNVLLLSESIIYGTGMAGRTGFFSMQNDRLVNRFFDGGHSHYFESKDFISKYWLPLLELDSPIYSIDNRIQSFWKNELLERLFYLLGKIKFSLYCMIIVYIAYIIFELVYSYTH
jgi:CheY-like chemotaxis protein